MRPPRVFYGFDMSYKHYDHLQAGIAKFLKTQFQRGKYRLNTFLDVCYFQPFKKSPKETLIFTVEKVFLMDHNMSLKWELWPQEVMSYEIRENSRNSMSGGQSNRAKSQEIVMMEMSIDKKKPSP